MKRVNAPPIPEGIRVKLEGEQEWKDVMQVFEDVGWLWLSGIKPLEKETCACTKIETNSSKTIAAYSDVPITQELTATEFLNQYQGTIVYEPGDWVVFIDTGCFTTVNQKIGDIVKILENNSQKERWSYKTTEGTIVSVYPINTRIRPATPEEIASVTKQPVEQPKEPDVYIWDGDVLPDEYWVENPWPGKDHTEFVDLFNSMRKGNNIGGANNWYHVKDSKYRNCYYTKPDTELPIVPYELWKSILEQPDPQAEPVAIKPRYHIDNVMDQNIAISCPTIELWDAVIKLIPNNRLTSSKWEIYEKAGNAININKAGGSHCHISWYKEERYLIITAEEFLRDNGVAVPQPKWSIVTTDGVTVYEGDKVWWVNPDGKTLHGGMNGNEWLTALPGNERAVEAGYKVFSTYEAAEKYRQEQLEPPSTEKEMWKVGDILPSEWLDSGIEDYRSYKGKSRGTSKKYYIGHRCVEQVREGWALISDTADIWLAPKDQYPTYPKAGSPDIVAKDGSIHDVKTVEPMIERTWKIGDKFTNVEGAIITITGPDEVDTHVLATWVKRDGSIIHGKPAKTGIDKWLQRKEWVPYNPEPIPVTKENAYIGMKVIHDAKCESKYPAVRYEVGEISKIAEDWYKIKYPKNWPSGLHYEWKDKVYIAQEEVSVNQTINQTTNKKTENNGNNNQQPQKDSYSSNNQSSSITNFRVYPKVTSGQGYSTGKSSPAVYKVKPTVIEGYHREYSRK